MIIENRNYKVNHSFNSFSLTSSFLRSSENIGTKGFKSESFFNSYNTWQFVSAPVFSAILLANLTNNSLSLPSYLTLYSSAKSSYWQNSWTLSRALIISSNVSGLKSRGYSPFFFTGIQLEILKTRSLIVSQLLFYVLNPSSSLKNSEFDIARLFLSFISVFRSDI